MSPKAKKCGLLKHYSLSSKYIKRSGLTDTQKYDVVCIGGGGAGVTAAVTAASLSAKVAIVTKDLLGYGNTRIAGGRMLLPGIAPGDSPKEFLQDILTSGESLSRRDLAETFAVEGSSAVPIVESFGHMFKRDTNGKPSGKLEKARGSRFPRTVKHPAKGVPMGHALRAAVFRSEVDVLEETVVTKVLVKDGQVEGVVCLRLVDGEVLVLMAKAVLIATGGLGWLFYPRTHNIRTATGDGYGLALNAGAELIDMEQVQFRNFAITHPKCLVGIGCNPKVGRLLDNKGEVVLALESSSHLSYSHITGMIAMAIERGGGSRFGGLTVDFSQYYTKEGREILKKHLKEGPHDLVRRAYGDKASRREEPWDVAPAQRYQLGGVKIDEFCQSAVDGLFAAGEVAGGLHGGSRLTDSALAEIFIFGRRAGRFAVQSAQKAEGGFTAGDEAEEETTRVKQLFGSAGSERPIRLKRRLQRLMWEKVGPVRTEEKLQEALSQIEEIKNASRSLTVSGIKRYNLEALDAIELPLMLATAEAIVISALQRQESRGAHIRLDFPARDDENWLRHIVVWKEDERIRVRAEKIKQKAAGGLTDADD